LMIRNLPRRFTSWDLVAELQLYIRRSSFDYIYVPWDKKGVNGMGFAFVNFVSPEMAVAACSAMENREWKTGYSTKRMQLVFARIQGLAENLRRFADQCDEQDGRHAPLIFVSGVQVRIDAALYGLCGAEAKQASPSCDSLSTAASFDEGMMAGSSVSEDYASVDTRRAAVPWVPIAAHVKATAGYAASQQEVIAMLKRLLAA